MIDQFATLKKQTKLAENVYEIKLQLDQEVSFTPGQFVELQLDGFFLRRPISICDVNNDVITLLYKVVGHGTKAMTLLPRGARIKVLGPCGNGFDLYSCPKTIKLVGGGIGIPPLYYLAKKAIEKGIEVEVILGFNTKSEVFYEQEFKDLGCKVFVTTVDGSYQTKGFVTHLLEASDYVCTCGPYPMLKAIAKLVSDGQYSLEARMGCGFGACMGCSIQTTNGNKRVCKEGPVFKQKEVLW